MSLTAKAIRQVNVLIETGIKCHGIASGSRALTTKVLTENTKTSESSSKYHRPAQARSVITAPSVSVEDWSLPSKYPDIEVPTSSYGDFMGACMEKYADNVALVNGETGQEYTYRQYKSMGLSVASALARLGVSRGDVVAVVAPNCVEYYFTFFGSSLLGAIVSPINPMGTPGEIRGLLSSAQASVVVCHNDNIQSVLKSCEDLESVRHITVVEGNGDHGTIPFQKLLKDDGKGIPQNVEIDPVNDVLAMPFSSGTTGLPKGVLLTHQNLNSNVVQLIDNPEVVLMKPAEAHQETVLNYLPLFHIYGLNAVMNISIFLGGRIVVLKGFNRDQFVDAINSYKITTLHTVPPILGFLTMDPAVNKENMSHCYNIVSASAPSGPALLGKFFQKFGQENKRIIEAYGMTEFPASHITDPANYVIGSCGASIPNTHSKIVDPVTGEQIKPQDGVVGELCLKGPQMMKGYHNNEEATRNTITDGWLHTGDVVRLDEDQNMFVIDRVKELIKVKGQQVAPAELEDLLRQHPSVREVAVIGVPDERAGEVPKAFVVSQEGCQQNPEELIDFVRENMSKHKHLEGGVEYIQEIPKSPAGKILRKALKN